MATMASFQAVVNVGCAALCVSVGLKWNRRKKAFEAEYNNYFEKSCNIRLEKQQDKFFFSLLLGEEKIIQLFSPVLIFHYFAPLTTTTLC